MVDYKTNSVGKEEGGRNNNIIRRVTQSADRAKERREDHNPDHELNVAVADFEAFHAVAPLGNIDLLIGLRFRSEIVKKPDAPQDDDHVTPRGVSTLKRKGGDDTPGVEDNVYVKHNFNMLTVT
ncbi:suppressor of mec-8 and unc-52 protein homolog 2 [Tanacetum coccineum]